MKTPFLILAALFSLQIAGPAFADEMLPAYKPNKAAPTQLYMNIGMGGVRPVPPPSARELQRRVDHAQDALQDFDESHPNRTKWSADDETQHAALEHRMRRAEEALKLTARTPHEAPLPSAHGSQILNDLDKAWNHIESAAAGVTEGVFEAFGMIRDGARDAYIDGVDSARRVTHVRPLLFSEYIDVVKKGKQVSFIYCDSRIANLNPMGSQHCEKLHAGSFSAADLRGCLASAPDDIKQPGMILDRQMESSLGENRDFGVDHLKMFDTKENYSAYLNSCHARVAGNRPAVVKHRPAVVHAAPAPLPELRVPASPANPVAPEAPAAADDQNMQAAPAVEVGGTL